MNTSTQVIGRDINYRCDTYDLLTPWQDGKQIAELRRMVLYSINPPVEIRRESDSATKVTVGAPRKDQTPRSKRRR